MKDVFTNWCEMNRLIINKEKTVAVSFHHPVINYTEHIKFLELWLDKKEYKVVNN
jgi:hypothetical protein